MVLSNCQLARQTQGTWNWDTRTFHELGERNGSGAFLEGEAEVSLESDTGGEDLFEGRDDEESGRDAAA